MGAWGFGALEEDGARDWVGDFARRPSVEVLRAALTGAAPGKYVGSRQSSRALAAAEVVAAWNGKAHPVLDASIVAWTATQGPLDPSLLVEAKSAIEQVFASSDPRDSWKDAGRLDAWKSALDELTARLS